MPKDEMFKEEIRIYARFFLLFAFLRLGHTHKIHDLYSFPQKLQGPAILTSRMGPLQ